MRDVFARTLGFRDYDSLIIASRKISQKGNISQYITELPDGRWAVWNDNELAYDRVAIFDHRVNAEMRL